MLIKFESKRAASFHMQRHIAEQLLTAIGQGGKLEGSISGGAVDQALLSLDRALAKNSASERLPDDEEDEQDYVSLSARAAPLRELLEHAKRAKTYLMWQPD